MHQFGVISLLPEIFSALNYGIVGRAREKGLAEVRCWNPRDYVQDQRRQVDDKPYGGGPGMVMMYEPLAKAVVQAKAELPSNSQVIYLSPQGRQITQTVLNDIIAKRRSLIFVAGRYEGIDERFIEEYVDEEWSIGDFVLSGGEFAALVFVDALIRLIPGSIGHLASAAQDSFMQGLLDYPHYTRPPAVSAKKVPDVLLQGDHQAIACWRRQQALGKTWQKRPDLLDKVTLTAYDQQLLDAFIEKYTHSN